MSQRIKVPAPFGRFHPKVIRSPKPWIIIFAGGVAALFLVVGGGSYVISRVNPKPATPHPTSSSTAELSSQNLSTEPTLQAAAVPQTASDSQPATVSSTPAVAATSPAPTATSAATPSVTAFDNSVQSNPTQSLQNLVSPVQKIVNGLLPKFYR